MGLFLSDLRDSRGHLQAQYSRSSSVPPCYAQDTLRRVFDVSEGRGQAAAYVPEIPGGGRLVQQQQQQQRVFSSYGDTSREASPAYSGDGIASSYQPFHRHSSMGASEVPFYHQPRQLWVPPVSHDYHQQRPSWQQPNEDPRNSASGQSRQAYEDQNQLF